MDKMTRKHKIMVIEDDVLLLQAITSKLSKTNYDVISCAAGKQALNYLEKLPNMPDLIWLDYYLGDMDGVEFMQTIKKIPKMQNIPVIVVSNSASPHNVDEMKALGAKEFLLKAHYRLEEIVDIIKEGLKQV
jgi:CheY-like chemotaxis protein